MNWEAIGSAADTIAAIGVIVTLIYLALQIRQANKDSQASAIQELGRDWEQHTSTVVSHENISTFLKGLDSYSSLDPEERLKFDYCVLGFLNIMEHATYKAGAGRVAEVMDMYEKFLSHRLFTYPGVEEWWEHSNGSGLGEPLQDWITNQIWHFEDQN